MKERHTTSGRCHCGNIRFEFDSGVPRSELPVRVCGCAFCVRHGARYTSDPGGAVHVEIDDRETVDRRLTRRKENWIGTVTMPALCA